MTGIVKNYNPIRGYGFITPLIGKPDNTPSVYFHHSAVARERPGDGEPALPAGCEVRFDLVRGGKDGLLQAANVVVQKVNAKALWKSAPDEATLENSKPAL